MKVLFGVGVALLWFSWGVGAAGKPSGWLADFEQQPSEKRPALEVRYTDGNREVFEILAKDYHLVGQLRAPHELRDVRSGTLWLSFAVTDASGVEYAARNAAAPSRINLYRRGPYYAEVHWLDITLADENGQAAPLKGDLALYCYPDQLLGCITWHASEDFAVASVRVGGIRPREFAGASWAKGESRRFAFDLHGTSDPLPAAALTTLEAKSPLEYDPVRGCYTIGSHNPGGFEEHFYHHPNHYETVRFRVSNDERPRTLYICHRTVGGSRGTVEGGVLLDEAGHPLPMTVQISKNFAGEKEEKFYNPTDEPFSETWFPLVLAPNERCTLSSLHLYQNWGRHMVKQFSSLGAWMDYFHSSSGVTETTCYVPFKFAGLPGVAIADFRAMSQTSFWGGQPQHDNVAGHSFLSYHDGEAWQYLTYQGTTYDSTGPNWMDVTLRYLSTDGKVRATVRTFEMPQQDELRNFIQVRYEVQAPLVVRDARRNFRLLTVASWVQRLRYTHFAATGIEDRPLEFHADHFGILGQPIPETNAFIAVYGEGKGSNAILLQSWSAKCGPAASVWCEEKGDTRLLLVPDSEDVGLEAGDVIEFEAVFLPYGEVGGASTCRRETVSYGSNAPKLVGVTRGRRLADFPTTIRAVEDQAEFVLCGGSDLVPVIVTGLSDYRWPCLYQRRGLDWVHVAHSRVGRQDGQQVFREPDGSYGAVFLVASDDSPQSLRFRLGPPESFPPRIQVRPQSGTSAGGHSTLEIQAGWMGAPALLRYPGVLSVGDSESSVGQGEETDLLNSGTRESEVRWAESAGGSLWYEVGTDRGRFGGRISPNETDVDLEFWVRNTQRQPVSTATWFRPVLDRTEFEDPEFERTWILRPEGWQRLAEVEFVASRVESLDAVAIESRGRGRFFAVAWPEMSLRRAGDSPDKLEIGPAWPTCPPGRRTFRRGKLYLVQEPLAELGLRIRREVR